MSIFKGFTHLSLLLFRKIFVAIKQIKIVIGCILDMADLFRSNTAPSTNVKRKYLVACQNPPMLPSPALIVFDGHEDTTAKGSFQNFFASVLAFCVLASGTVGGRYLYSIVSDYSATKSIFVEVQWKFEQSKFIENSKAEQKDIGCITYPGGTGHQTYCWVSGKVGQPWYIDASLQHRRSIGISKSHTNANSPSGEATGVVRVGSCRDVLSALPHPCSDRREGDVEVLNYRCIIPFSSHSPVRALHLRSPIIMQTTQFMLAT